ncbi:uncharacterized protein BYT42DRAFT_574721 [Radiomyces spectabilis]|uniref:uncharacterized protein n=1 Tax=Radiomyces spectabilis TaxID=64574 RepID=UPI00221F3C09|nr:uncharacterized protein BYT42DRAFT_574721 [Radiomyces spectabilis]KAI8376468.1 hypothetical protein BYT42DRAFT_574721 [Radiomyces spectabilis]
MSTTHKRRSIQPRQTKASLLRLAGKQSNIQSSKDNKPADTAKTETERNASDVTVPPPNAIGSRKTATDRSGMSTHADPPKVPRPKSSPYAQARASEGVRAFMAQQRARQVARKTNVEPEKETPPKSRVFTGAERYTSGPDASRGEAFGNQVTPPNAKLQTLIRQAKSSGKLNISSRGLDKIPEEVLNMYHVDPNSIVVDFSSSSDDAWYDAVELNKLIVGDNSLTKLDTRVGEEFGALVLLDLRHNLLSTLPESLIQLRNLTVLQLPYNHFEEVPSCVTKMKSLRELDLSHNRLTQVPVELAQIDRLEILELGNNQIKELPRELTELGMLRKLNVQHNQLTSFPKIEHATEWQKLEELVISQNRLRVLFPASISLLSLQRLDAQHNQISDLMSDQEMSVQLPMLEELLLSHNRLSSVSPGVLASAPKLQTLALAWNTLAEIPDSILQLEQLKRLDVSNNEIRSLSPDLSNLSQLMTFNYEGNPIRTLPKNMTMTELMEYLQSMKITE